VENETPSKSEIEMCVSTEDSQRMNSATNYLILED